MLFLLYNIAKYGKTTTIAGVLLRKVALGAAAIWISSCFQESLASGISGNPDSPVDGYIRPYQKIKRQVCDGLTLRTA
jgi:hypothetical protein